MTVKRKTVLQFGVALLSIGVAAIPGGSRISDKVVFAEELSAFESNDEFTSVAPEHAEGQNSTEDSSTQEPANDSETVSEAPTLTSVALNIDPDAETIPVEFLDYVNYYILRIKWNENVKNNKETDMIYIMVG